MVKYKKGYKYQLQETYAISTGIVGFSIYTDFLILDIKGNLVIKKGYAWDGATGFPDIEVVMEPSLVHDAGYQLIRLGLMPESYKKVWDALLLKVFDEVASRKKLSTVEKAAVHLLLEKGVEYFGFIGLGEERTVYTTV